MAALPLTAVLLLVLAGSCSLALYTRGGLQDGAGADGAGGAEPLTAMCR